MVIAHSVGNYVLVYANSPLVCQATLVWRGVDCRGDFLIGIRLGGGHSLLMTL